MRGFDNKVELFLVVDDSLRLLFCFYDYLVWKSKENILLKIFHFLYSQTFF